MARHSSFRILFAILVGALGVGACQDERPSVPSAAETAATAASSDEPLTGDYSGQNLDSHDFASAFLEGSDFTSASLVGADFSGASLLYADFTGANLTDANLSAADLRNTVFRDADLTRANLTNTSLFAADLRSANISNANLTGVDFFEANLQGADLTDATLDRASLGGVHGLTRAMLSDAIGVPDEELAEALQDLQVRWGEISVDIDLNPVCDRGNGAPLAAPYSEGDAFHPIALLGDPMGYGHLIQKLEWTATATPFAQLVVCAKDRKPVIVKNCGSYGVAGHDVFLAQEKWEITLHEARTARVIAMRQLIGPTPSPQCPQSVRADQAYITGGQPHFDELRAFLGPYVGSPPKS